MCICHWQGSKKESIHTCWTSSCSSCTLNPFACCSCVCKSMQVLTTNGFWSAQTLWNPGTNDMFSMMPHHSFAMLALTKATASGSSPHQALPRPDLQASDHHNLRRPGTSGSQPKQHALVHQKVTPNAHVWESPCQASTQVTYNQLHSTRHHSLILHSTLIVNRNCWCRRMKKHMLLSITLL